MEIMDSNKKFLVNGKITSDMISNLIQKHQSDHEIGAHSLFLGQVRADKIISGESLGKGSEVTSIVYTAYEEMAENEISRIKETAIRKFGLHCLFVYHSIGEVKAGEISLFVMASSSHRDSCMDSMREIVNEIKDKVPIWKKEIFTDGTFRWVE